MFGGSGTGVVVEKAGWIVVLVGWVGVVGGCGGGDSERDPCAEVTCEFGVCDEASGECRNEEPCGVDRDCLAGYECEDKTCTARTECESDDDCDPGLCSESGVCTNPDSCTEDAECLSGTYCRFDSTDAEEGTCRRDPCNDIVCQRGVCERGSDECVSEESCTKETEVEACVNGEKCAVPEGEESGECRTEENFCEGITCERGVCSFQAGGCADATDCQEDAECLAGKFCSDSGECRPNLCVERDIECIEGGVCVPSSGECENAEPCESNDDCLDAPAHLCVDGTCRLESAACGDAGGDGGCPGNQNCEYDADELTAECTEPSDCATSLDCLDDRQCNGETCTEAQSCAEDVHEPNDSVDEATDFHEGATDRSLSASLCPGDVDVYTVTSTEFVPQAESGTLLVELDVPERERGLGELTLTVINPDGDEVGTATTGADGREPKAEVASQLAVVDHGDFQVEVTGGDGVKTSGVDYDLSATVVSDETIEACDEAEPLPIDASSRIAGTTEEAAGSSLGSTCTDPQNPSPEKVYALQLEESQELDIELIPRTEDADLTMSLRSRCTQLGSERDCSAPDDENPEMTAVLGEGTHYLVVQAPAGEEVTGGEFELSVERVFTTCSSRNDYCDGQTANVCAPDGGAFQQIECEAGCDVSTGECVPAEGNRCENAPAIEPSDTEDRSIDFGQLADEYAIGGGGCLGEAPTRSGGADAVYRVTIPPRTAFTAEASFDSEVRGSMYLVDDCGALGSSCEAGAKGSTDDASREQLTYSNYAAESDEEDNAETKYLVVDTEADAPASGAELAVSYEDVVCESPTRECHEGDVRECAEYGRSWNRVQECSDALGCGNQECLGDTCSNPVDVTTEARQQTHGVSYTATWEDFADDYGGDATCSETEHEDVDADVTEGRETVYAVDMQAGERLEATLSGVGNLSLYLKDASNCGSPDTACHEAIAREFSQPASVAYVADTAKTVNVVADREEREPGDRFTIDINLESPACNPHTSSQTCADSSTHETCTIGGEYRRRSCVDCSSGSCGADTCGNAREIPADGETHVYEVTPELYSDDYAAEPSCLDDESVGEEAAFQVTVDPGDVLRANWRHDDPALYLVESCSDIENTCLAGESETFETTLDIEHQFSSQGTYYLIPDLADAGEFTDYGTGRLEATVLSGNCSSGSDDPQCTGSDQRQVCSQSYSRWERRGCPGCDAGSCAGDSCSDAVSVPADGTEHTWEFNPEELYTDSLDVGPASCTEDSDDNSPGRDAVFAVDADQGDLIEATWDHDEVPSLYIVTDCDDVGSSCVAGREDTSGPVSTSHVAQQDQTYYVVADVDEYQDSTDYSEATLRIRAGDRPCDPASSTPTCDGTDTLEYCVEPGVYETRRCLGGCSSGECGTPSGAVCADAIPAGDGDNFNFQHVGTNNLDPVASGATGSCSFPTDTEGGDFIHEVDLTGGETLTAQSTSEASDGVMYLLTECTDTTSCQEAVDADGGSISYTAASGGESVYVVIDHDDATTEDPGGGLFGGPDAWGLDISVQ